MLSWYQALIRKIQSLGFLFDDQTDAIFTGAISPTKYTTMRGAIGIFIAWIKVMRISAFNSGFFYSLMSVSQ
jgi:uncharacterized membrane protein YobD (UPF0266 family)